jgi:hypothetical protein
LVKTLFKANKDTKYLPNDALFLSLTENFLCKNTLKYGSSSLIVKHKAEFMKNKEDRLERVNALLTGKHESDYAGIMIESKGDLEDLRDYLRLKDFPSSQILFLAVNSMETSQRAVDDFKGRVIIALD